MDDIRHQYELNFERDKILLLTGCANFGSMDGTNGSCHYCYHDNKFQWERCKIFCDVFQKFHKEQESNRKMLQEKSDMNVFSF